ncbi:MAG TPA: sensor histidine kinase [Desulfobulbaceae bacterium]|nr:sensor histidine kinase [Desulfobulbaceae bacterium]
MSQLSPAHNRDRPRLLLISLWFGVLIFIFLYLLPLLVLKHSPIPGKITLWLSGIVLLAVFFGITLFPQTDKEYLLKQSITYTILLGIIFGLYAGLLTVFEQLSPGSPNLSAAFFYFLLTVALLFYPLRHFIQSAVDQYIFRSRPDYRTLLCDFSGRISSSLHLPDLIKVLISELPKQLHITGIGLMIMDEKRSRLYPENLRIGSHLWSESRLISLLSDGQHYLFCNTITDDPALSDELMEIEKSGFSLVYGLQGGSQFVGMLLLGPKKDGSQYSNRDVQVFSTLANQVTIAIENALNYETLSESKDQLQLLYNKLVQAEKMAALGEMTAILAHELKNPLGIIRSSAQFLVEGKREQAIRRKLLRYIIDEVDNLNLVITNLLGLARHKPPRFRKVDLKKEITEFVTQWRQSCDHNKRVKIELSFPGHLPILYADFKQLRQVLLNCLSNSEEVMPKGGTISISVRELENERVEIILTDTGPGVAEDDLKLIFKKFFTTKKKGVGLGLPVCRQIVRAHNGSITLVNNPDDGASIILHLPLRPLVTIGRHRQPGPVALSTQPDTSYGKTDTDHRR